MGVLTLREEDQKSLQVPDPWSGKAFPGEPQRDGKGFLRFKFGCRVGRNRLSTITSSSRILATWGCSLQSLSTKIYEFCPLIQL